MNKEQIALKTFDLLESTGLNWTVTKEPLVSLDGKPTNSFGLFRKDNHSHLATVGKRYEPYQNYQLAEALIEATESIDLPLTRGGQLSGGGKVYLQAELPEMYIGKSGVQRYITGVNSHDGTTSIGFGSSGTVIVCQNTWYMAFGQLSKFRHTVSAEERIKVFIEGMRTALGLELKLLKRFKQMSELPVPDELYAKVIQNSFDLDVDAPLKGLNERIKQKVTTLATSIAKEYELEGNTMWGLFNGITRYTNHHAVKPEKKTDYIMSGGGYKTNLAAYITMDEWLAKHYPELTEIVTN